MKVNDLQATANKAKKRVGRGISAGGGKTAGRGTKGQKARTGKKLRATFMGGQGSLMQRIPKHRGFKSLRVPAQIIYTDVLSEFAGKTVDNHSASEASLITTPFHSVKVILRGEVKGAVTVKLQGASKGAIEAIAKAGGSFEKIEVPHLPESKRKKEEKTEQVEAK